MTKTELGQPDAAAKTVDPPPDPQIRVLNPATGEVAGSVADMSAGQVVAAIADLREQQREWQAVGPDERKKWLLELQDWIIDNTEVLADAAVRNR